MHRAALVRDPAIAPVVVTQAILHMAALALVEGVAIRFDAPLEIVRVDPLRPALALFLLQRAAAKLEPGLVEVADRSVGTGGPDQTGQDVEGGFLG